MKIRFMDMIDSFIDHERSKELDKVEGKTRSKRIAIEEFAFYMDRQKGKLWKITDITETEAKSYYYHLKYREKAVRETLRKIQILNHFMDYAVSRGWLEERPWDHLFEPEKGGEGHFRISETDRLKLIQYLKLSRPKEFFEMRDRAMLMILLEYRLQRTEVSRMNITDYTGKTIKTRSPFLWREREIKIKDIEERAIDEYIMERKKRKEALKEEALFIGYKRRRISPGMVKKKLKVYLDRIKEE